MMMKTTALVALVALGSFSASRAQDLMQPIYDPYGPDEVPAVTAGGSCTQNAPSDVQNPAGAIVSGTMCYACAGNTQTYFDMNNNGAYGEDSVGCYCEDGSACVSWAATESEVNLNTFLDEDDFNYR